MAAVYTIAAVSFSVRREPVPPRPIENRTLAMVAMNSSDAATWAFVDEYGNPNLAIEKEGVSSYFIIAAVLVRSERLEEARAAAESVRKAHFQQGEMKSRGLGGDHSRWMKVFRDLAVVPFSFYGLAVDKARLNRDSGFEWKQSFYKNLCGRAYGKIMRAHPGLHVRADEYGRSEFMESFATYIRDNHRPTLFDRGTFDFVNGQSEVLVQVADLVSGLLARLYDPEKHLPRADDILELVADRVLSVDEWPVKFRARSDSNLATSSASADSRIANQSATLAENFIAQYEGSKDDEIRARVAVLERLLVQRQFGDGDRAVATAALVENLAERGIAVNDTWIRRNVIGPLRDRELLITSSPQGYKLPNSTADLAAFFRHADSVCVPMVNRVRSANNTVRLATLGEVDVLADPEFAQLRSFSTALETLEAEDRQAANALLASIDKTEGP